MNRLTFQGEQVIGAKRPGTDITGRCNICQKSRVGLFTLHFHWNVKNCSGIRIRTIKIILQSIIQSNFGPSNSDESNTMDGSNWFESPVNFPYIFKYEKPLSLEHRYLEQSNSINGPVNNKITSFTMPNSNIAI